MLLDMTRIWKFGASAGNAKIGDAQVNTDCCSFTTRNGVFPFLFGQDSCKVLTTGILRDGYSLDLTFYLSMQTDFYPTQFWEINQIINELSPLRILNRLLSMFRFETGILRSFLEEVDKRFTQIQCDRLQNLRMALAQPGELFLEVGQKYIESFSGQSFPCLFVGSSSLIQGIVPPPSSTAEKLGKLFGLRVGWIDSGFDRLIHHCLSLTDLMITEFWAMGKQVICSSPHTRPISLDNQDSESRGTGNRRLTRLSSHRQASTL